MEQDYTDQGIRLKKLIKELKLTQVTFAKSLGMTQPNISRMVSGENNMKNPDHTDPSYRKILTPLYRRNLTPCTGPN